MLSQLYNLMSSSAEQPEVAPKDENEDASLPTEVDADDFHLVDVSQGDGQDDKVENPVEPTVEETEQEEAQDRTQGLLFEISNRNGIIAQMKGLLEAKDKEMKMVESCKNDLLNEISSRNAIIAQMKMLLAANDLEARDFDHRDQSIAQMEDLLSEKDRVLQEQGEIKEREIENRDATIARMKDLLDEKDKQIKGVRLFIPRALSPGRDAREHVKWRDGFFTLTALNQKLEPLFVNDETLRNLVMDYKKATEEQAKIEIISLRWLACIFVFIAIVAMTGFWNQFTFMIACFLAIAIVCHLAKASGLKVHPDTLRNSIMDRLTSSVSEEKPGPTPEKPGPASENPGPARTIVLQKRNGQFGIYFSAKMIITACIPDSPADRSGITRGDEILFINGVNVEAVSFYEVIELLNGSVGETTLIVRYNLQKLKE